MWKPSALEVMPGFWPPKVNGFWTAMLEPLRRYYLRRFYRVSQVELRNTEVFSVIAPGDGILIAPNHSHDSDPHVMMEAGKQLGRHMYFMAAWQVFLAHKGIDGWVMQRFGAFSVDREGCDRRAIRQATEILTRGQSLVVFPEGEIYHTNERLTPLREGVAFMAITAQRDLEKDKNPARVWVVPAAIKYVYDEDVTPKLQASVEQMESRFMLKPLDEATLPQRIVRLGEVLLTIQEKQKLGHSRENEGDVPTRISFFISTLLEKLETQHLGKVSADTIPVRVKAMRRHLLEAIGEENATSELKSSANQAFDDLHLVLQLYSYPGNYVSSKPTLERMAETIEKFEEDTAGVAAPKGSRRTTVTFAPPIDVRPMLTVRPRAATAELTSKLEESLRHVMGA